MSELSRAKHLGTLGEIEALFVSRWRTTRDVPHSTLDVIARWDEARAALAGVGVARPAEPPQESLATGPDVIAAIDEEIAQAASVWESNPTLTAMRDARATIVALTKEVTGLREQLAALTKNPSAGGASVGDTKL